MATIKQIIPAESGLKAAFGHFGKSVQLYYVDVAAIALLEADEGEDSTVMPMVDGGPTGFVCANELGLGDAYLGSLLPSGDEETDQRDDARFMKIAKELAKSRRKRGSRDDDEEEEPEEEPEEEEEEEEEEDPDDDDDEPEEEEEEEEEPEEEPEPEPEPAPRRKRTSKGTTVRKG